MKTTRSVSEFRVGFQTAAAAVLVVTGCAGGAPGQPDQAQGVVSGPADGCLPLAADEELLDDLSDGDRFIPALAGRGGAWFVAAVGGPLRSGAAIAPDPRHDFAPSQTGDGCRRHAACVTVHGYDDVDLGVTLGAPHDLSAFRGIRFWASSDAFGATARARVSFPDRDTQPEGGACSNARSSGPTACLDHFGARVAVGEQWQQHTVQFHELTQDGWGQPATAFDASTVYQIRFRFPVDVGGTACVDDVVLLR